MKVQQIHLIGVIAPDKEVVLLTCVDPEAAWHLFHDWLADGNRVVMHSGSAICKAVNNELTAIGGPAVELVRAILNVMPPDRGLLTEQAVDSLEETSVKRPPSARALMGTWQIAGRHFCTVLELDTSSVVQVPSRPPPSLPVLIERPAVVIEAIARLRSAGGRLLLHGPAGIGKRTMALAVAHRLFEKGSCRQVRRVSLQAGGSSEEVLRALARAVRMEGIASREDLSAEVVGAQLNGLSILEVEGGDDGHTIGLQHCLRQVWDTLPEGGQLIVTARPAWQHWPGIRVPGLDVEEGVALFERTLKTRRPDDFLSDSELHDVARLVRETDGNPAALRYFANQFGHGRDLASLSGSDSPVRDWHPRDLTTSEQSLLVAAAVCSGADLPALAAISGVAESTVTANVEGLCSRLLLNRDAATEGPGPPRIRYSTPLTLKSGAQKHLKPQVQAARSAHTEYFVALAIGTGEELWSENEVQHYATLHLDFDNFILALERIAQTDPDRAALMLVRLKEAFKVRGEYRNFLNRAERLLEALPSGSQIWLELELEIANAMRGLGLHSAGIKRASNVLDDVRQTDNDMLLVLALHVLATAPQPAGELYSIARRSLEEGYQLVSALKWPFWQAQFSYFMAIARMQEQKYREAMDVLEEGQLAAERSQSPTAIGAVQLGQGLLAMAQDQHRTAYYRFVSALEAWRPYGHRRRLCIVVVDLAHCALKLEELAAAQNWIDYGMDLARGVESPRLMGLFSANQAEVYVLQGQLKRASDVCHRALGRDDDRAQLAAHFRCLAATVAGLEGQIDLLEGLLSPITDEIRQDRAEPMMLARRAIEIHELGRRAADKPATAASRLQELDQMLASLSPAPDLWGTTDIVMKILETGGSRVREEIRALEEQELMLVVHRDGRWFELAGERVSLARRAAPRRIMAALAQRRAKGSGGLDVDQLFEAGWPDESVDPESARARVYVAISTLRKLGLGDILVNEADGYKLAPDVLFMMDGKT